MKLLKVTPLLLLFSGILSVSGVAQTWCLGDASYCQEWDQLRGLHASQYYPNLVGANAKVSDKFAATDTYILHLSSSRQYPQANPQNAVTGGKWELYSDSAARPNSSPTGKHIDNNKPIETDSFAYEYLNSYFRKINNAMAAAMYGPEADSHLTLGSPAASIGSLLRTNLQP